MTLRALIACMEGLLEAVWLVDPKTLRILCSNQAAAVLVGLSEEALVNRPVMDFTAAPEDWYFWEDVAAGLSDSIHSNTLLRCADGIAIPVERRVSRVWVHHEQPVFMVALQDLRAQRKVEEELDLRLAELRATLESTADGILVTDLQGRVRNFNRRFVDMWNLPPALQNSDDIGALAQHLANAVVDGGAYRSRMSRIGEQPLLEATDVVQLRSGHTLEQYTVPQFSHDRVKGRVYSFRDITSHVQADSQLRLATKVFESSPDAIFVTDAQYSIVHANPRCIHITGLTLNVLLGSSARHMFHHPEHADLFSQIEAGLQTQGNWSGEVWRITAGQTVAVEVQWVALHDAQGHITHTVGFFKDVTERLEAQRHIEKLAYRDVLTGLPNRLLLGQRVELALRMAERSEGQFAIIFIDLDRFKNINDSLGHAFGDQVLVEVAQRIQAGMREVDTLCRMSGDEFVGFLQDADAMGAEVAARRILHAVSQPFLIDDMPFSLGCSIGVAMYPADGRTLDDLIKSADTAMYRVKERGRGHFRFYQPQMNVDLLSRMKMDHAMRRAMEQGLFRLHYQPQVCLLTGRLLGAEALVRWTDPELGPVSPAAFIPLAEESGFIISIGNWVLEEAVRQAALWQHAGRPVTISVNVSALQFQQPDFVERVAGAIEAAGLQPSLIELELTESILVRDANEALARLHALAALGLSLAIDDFGTGYSSLAYLKKFPISKLKIDRTFVMGLPEDESDRAIVTATVAMARALRLTVVAEGVESVEQHNYLRFLQCASYQGFLCSPGVCASDFEKLADSLVQSTPEVQPAEKPVHWM